ncbi:hypothetical protein Ancab_021404 [Ancistrocladus abbreviatus]
MLKKFDSTSPKFHASMYITTQSTSRIQLSKQSKTKIHNHTQENIIRKHIEISAARHELLPPRTSLGRMQKPHGCLALLYAQINLVGVLQWLITLKGELLHCITNVQPTSAHRSKANHIPNQTPFPQNTNP